MDMDRLLDGKLELQDIWNAYQDAIDFNADKQTVNVSEENNNMYVGRQWEGIEIEEEELADLPIITLNFIRPVVQIKVANIMSTKTKIVAQPVGLAGVPTKQQEFIADIVNKQLEKICEREDFDNKVLELMTNTAVDGDGCWYGYWDEDIETGQSKPGDFSFENIRNVNVFFGNPLCNEVQRQPFTIVERREYTSNLKSYAKKIGLKDGDISAIQPDTDNQYTINNDDNRVTVLTFFWRDFKTNTIKMNECTQNVMLQENVDTGLKNYPVCWQNWEPVLNSYHGEACVTEMVSNQIAINRLATMQAISLSRTAFPTVVYNEELLPGGWDNSVGAAIPIKLFDVKATDVATTISPANHASELDRMVDWLLNSSKDLNGANDAMLGNIKPENTSAIIAVQKSATVPLELNKLRLYKFLQDFARMAIDFMANYYGERQVLAVSPESGEEEVMPFDFSQLQHVAFNIKIDVGASSYWSEITESQTLDNLFDRQIITPDIYLKYLPNGLLAYKQEIIAELKQLRQAEQFATQQDALMTMLEKSPETAQRLQQLKGHDPEAYEQMVQQLFQNIQG